MHVYQVFSETKHIRLNPTKEKEYLSQSCFKPCFFDVCCLRPLDQILRMLPWWESKQKNEGLRWLSCISKGPDHVPTTPMCAFSYWPTWNSTKLLPYNIWLYMEQSPILYWSHAEWYIWYQTAFLILACYLMTQVYQRPRYFPALRSGYPGVLMYPSSHWCFVLNAQSALRALMP